MTEPAVIVEFWKAAGYDRWYTADPAFDEAIRERFFDSHEAAVQGRLDAWRATSQGALALVIVLDQFSRNLFRGTPGAFAADPMARALADEALARGFDREVEPELREFFYLPFMHSEDLGDQHRCVALYEAIGDDSGRGYAIDHRDIIERFGRFPHRNAILGRPTTAEEQAFLDGGGFSG